ncbi:MAG: hypothetical protein ACYDBJ_21645 [Aggregatilineales bacterium]
MTVLSRSVLVRLAHALNRPQRWKRLALFSFVAPLRTYAPLAGTGPFDNLATQLNDMFTSLLTIAHNIAPAVGILGFIGLGLMYMGSTWPIIGPFKQQHPQAASDVMLGLFFVLFASLVVSIIPNPGGFA